MQHSPITLKESQLAGDHRLAICIDQIPRVSQHQEILLEIDEEQSQDDIDICRYSTKDGTSFYSMAMALTKPGVIDVMQRTALRFPSCRLRIVSFQALRKAKRDKTYWPCTESVQEKPIRLTQAQQDPSRGNREPRDSVTLPDSDERDNSSRQNSNRGLARDVIILEGNDEDDDDENDEYEQYTEDEDCCDHEAFPLELAIKVFLGKKRKAASDDEALDRFCARRMQGEEAGPMTRAQAEAQTAAYEAERLVTAARRVLDYKQELEQALRKKEDQEHFDLSDEYQRRERRFARADIYEATELAWHRILDADFAREEAKLLDEIARFQDESVHEHQPEPAIRYTVIYCRDGIDTSSVPLSPLDIVPAPCTIVQGTRRWKFAVPLRLYDQTTCTQHLTRQLTAEGISEGEYSISYLLSNSGKSFTYMQIAFERSADFEQAGGLRFTWADRRLQLCSGLQSLDAPMALLSVENFLVKRRSNQFVRKQTREVSDTPLQSHIKRLESKMMDVRIVWRLDQDHQVRGETITLEGTSIVALVSYKQKRLNLTSTSPASNVYYAPEEVPGYIHTMQGYKPIQLSDRAPGCARCIVDYNLQHHTEEECTNGRCSVCGAKFDCELAYSDHIDRDACEDG